MIADIIKKLHSDDFYNVSESVEIAKGKNEIVTTWKDAFRQIKRIWLLQKK